MPAGPVRNVLVNIDGSVASSSHSCHTPAARPAPFPQVATEWTFRCQTREGSLKWIVGGGMHALPAPQTAAASATRLAPLLLLISLLLRVPPLRDCWAMCPTPHTMRRFACAPSPAQPAARAQRSRSSPTCWPCGRTPALSLARLPLRAGVRGDVNKPGRAANKLAGGQRSKQSWPATGPLVGPPPRCLRALMPGGWPAARTGATPRPPPAGSATRWQAASEAASSWPHLPPLGVQAPRGWGCASLLVPQTAVASATRPAPVPRWTAARLVAAQTHEQR